MSQAMDPSLISINSSWPGLIADLSVNFEDLRIDANTLESAPLVKGNGEWIRIDGHGSNGTFVLYLPADFCVSLFEAADSSFQIDALDGQSAALVLEHMFSERLGQLEQLLGHDLQFVSVSDVVEQVSDRLLGLELLSGDQIVKAALYVAGGLKDDLEYLVNANADFTEKELPSTVSVQLGPVAMSKRDAYLARRGEVIDCGVKPSDVIRGVLMRKDGRYWPIYIEDHAVEIAGPLAGPVSFSEAHGDQVYVTFAIGEATLTPLQRAQANAGTRFDVERYSHDEARIYYQAQPFATGNLSLHGDNLAVTIQSIGAIFE